MSLYVVLWCEFHRMRILHPPAILVVLVLTALNAALGASPERVERSLGEGEAAAMPEMEFYLASGETDACGRDCSRWIAAEGRIDISAAQRLRHLWWNRADLQSTCIRREVQ